MTVISRWKPSFYENAQRHWHSQRGSQLLHGLSQSPVTSLSKTKRHSLTPRVFTWLPSFDFCIVVKITVPQKSCFVYSRLSAYICRPAEKEERPWRCKLSHTTLPTLHKFKPQPQHKHIVPPLQDQAQVCCTSNTTFSAPSALSLPQHCLLRSTLSPTALAWGQPRERCPSNEAARCCSHHTTPQTHLSKDLYLFLTGGWSNSVETEALYCETDGLKHTKKDSKYWKLLTYCSIN